MLVKNNFSYFNIAENLISITSSFGIYTLDSYEATIDMKFMIGNADKNLYEAKRTGRNRSIK